MLNSPSHVMLRTVTRTHGITNVMACEKNLSYIHCQILHHKPQLSVTLTTVAKTNGITNNMAYSRIIYS